MTWPLYAGAALVIALLLPGVIAYRRRQNATARAARWSNSHVRLYRAPPAVCHSHPDRVNLLTFTLFFRGQLPGRYGGVAAGEKYRHARGHRGRKRKNGYDKPLFVNAAAAVGAVTDTIFFTKSLKLFAFDFGRSESGAISPPTCHPDVAQPGGGPAQLRHRHLGPNICVALMVMMFRATALDRWAVFVFVSLMSISTCSTSSAASTGGEELDAGADIGL